MYSKAEVIGYVWQYSRSYGDKLRYCEKYFEQREGYTSLLILFEITENICKSVEEDFKSRFCDILEKLKEKGIITEGEKEFLDWLRRLRNIFAHDNLSSQFFSLIEDGREIYYSLQEEESCLILYEAISSITFNIISNIIDNNLIVDIHTDLEEILLNFNKRISIK